MADDTPDLDLSEDMLERALSLREMKQLAAWLGYRFETSPDGHEERMYRPDGTLALTARRVTHG